VGRSLGKEKVDALPTLSTGATEDDLVKSFVSIQQDKHALQKLKYASEESRQIFNKARDGVYAKADSAAETGMLKELKQVHGDDIVEVRIQTGSNRKFDDVNITFDRDVYAVKKYYETVTVGGQTVRRLKTEQLPADFVRRYYEPALHEACGGQAGTGYANSGEFAASMDNVSMGELHAESLGKPADFQAATQNPAGNFTNPQQTGMAMTYKADHWFAKGEGRRIKNAFDLAANDAKIGNYAAAEGHMEEGMRQVVKQFDNMVIKRTAAINEKLAKAGLPPVNIDPVLTEGADIFRRVGTAPGQGLSPAQAEHILRMEGHNLSDVSEAMGKYIEMLQRLEPTLPL
jgi:hypothetical protein